jgi:hypothetical protein
MKSLSSLLIKIYKYFKIIALYKATPQKNRERLAWKVWVPCSPLSHPPENIRIPIGDIAKLGVQ